MKKNKLLILSASCALGLSLVGAGVGIALSEKANADTPSSTVFDDVLGEDAIGQKVKLGVGAETSDVTPEIETNIGVLAVDGEIAGTKDVRVYFRLNSINGIQTASLTRSVKTAAGEVVKEASTLDVDYVYSSINGAEEATWLDMAAEEPAVIATDELPAAPYYLVYTLKNIPADHWFDHVNVVAKLNGTEASPTQEFTYNVYGAIGDIAAGVIFAPRPDVEGEYYVKSSGAAEAVVPENYCEYHGAIATLLGKVTCVGDPTSTSGGFEYKSSLTSLTLPDTIDTFNKWSFSGVSSLKSLTLPRDLTTVLQSSFNNMNSLETIEYKALNLTTVDDTFDNEGLTVNVSGAVESLPDELITGEAELVNYEGTTAEWEALKTDTNQNNGLFIDNVICSDTVTHTVTFHLGEGTIGDLTGDVDYTVIEGKLAADPGDALLLGMAFKGWYMDQAGETPWNPETPVTGDLDIYAVYEEFGPGASASNPITLITGETYTENLVPGYEKVYLTYTHPADAEADWRYLYVDESACEESEVSTVTASNLDVAIDVYKGSFEGEKEELGSNDYVSDSAVKPIGTDGDIRFLAEPGQTYCFVIDPYSNDYYQDRVYYGSLAMKFLDFEEDSIEAAGQLVYGETSTVRRDDYTRSVMTPATVKAYTPTETKAVALNIGRTNGTWADVEVYDITDPVNPTSLGSDSDTSDSTMILNLEANHRYILIVDLNGATSDTGYVTLTIGEIPAGADISNPIAMTIGTPVTVDSINSEYSYYSLTLDEAADLAFTLNEGSSSYAKYFKVYDSAGEQVATATETGVQSGWGWDTTTTYGGELLERLHLEAGSYIVEVGYTSSLYSYTGFTFQVDYVQDGDYIGRPKAVDFEIGSSFDLTSRVDGFYYSFTSTTASNYLKIDLPADIENLAIELVDTDGSVIKTALTGGSLGFKVDVGSTYLLKVSGVDQDVTVTTSFVDTFEDGLARDTALTIDETGIINLNHLCGLDSASYWFKFTPSESGTYVLFSKNPDADTRFEGVYEGDSDVALEYEGNDDDDRNEHPQTQYRFDFAVEVQLEAGKTYYMKARLNTSSAEAMSVGYDLLTPGSTIGMAIESSFLETGGISLTGDDTGTFYSDVAEVAGYYTFPALTDGGASSVVIYVNGTEKATLSEAEVYLKVEAGDVVVAKVIGGAVNLSAVYSETVENGDSAPNAISIASGINDMTIYQTDSIQNPIWFKFTVATSGTYRIYSQSVNGSASSGVDSKINGLWADPADTTSGSSLCEANDDDSNEHDVTIYKWDFYVEVTLEAGVTYYASLKLPVASSIYGLNVVIELLPTA